MNNDNYKKLLALGLKVGDNIQIITNKKEGGIAVRFFVEDDDFISIQYHPDYEDKFLVRAGKQSTCYFAPTPRVKLIDYLFPGVRKAGEKSIKVSFDDINTAITKLPKYTSKIKNDYKYTGMYPRSIGEMTW